MALKDITKPRRYLRIYHGTYITNISRFDILKSRSTFLDFGIGIYFTTSLDQAKIWSIRHSNIGAVYEVIVDSADLNVKQYLTYSNEFIRTFCYCRAGLEERLLELKNYNSIYGYVIDNDKDLIFRKTTEYALGRASEAEVRASIKVFDDRDQLCIKNQILLNKLKINRASMTEYIPGYSRNDWRAVKWKK